MESGRNKTVKGNNGKLYRDKQDNYRSYFLRMYLIITQVWKMVKANRLNATNPSTTSSPWKKYSGKNPISITNHPIALFKNSKAHIPKKRPRNFFCFCINSLFIMEECKWFVTSVTKPVLTGWNRSIYFIFRRIIRTFQVLKHYDYTT